MKLLVIALLASLSYLPKKEVFEGYVVTLDNDTIHGQFHYNSTWASYKIQREIISKPQLTLNVSGTYIKYEPKQLKSYGINFYGEWQNYLVIDNGYGHFFAKELISGNVSLLSYWIGNDIRYSYTRYFVLIRDSNQQLEYFPSGCFSGLCKKEILDFFENCPEITSRIKNKSYRKNNDWIAIVKDYNAICTNN